MRILTSLTYYKPYISGLTIYAQRIAEELAQREHEIIVLTAQLEGQKQLEELERVQVIRVPALLKLSKGLIMPQMVIKGWKLLNQSDVLHIHMPQFDAFYLTLFAKIKKKPIIVTYQCDLDLPKGFVNLIANFVTNMVSRFVLRLADIIVTTSMDYAQHSNLLRSVLYKVEPCLTPIESKTCTEEQYKEFLKKFDINSSQPIIGMAGRLATEKGMEVMVDAFDSILLTYSNALFLHAGNSSNVLGEEKYRDLIFAKTKKYGPKWRFLGKLSEVELSAFYQACDVLAFPSLNSTEAFGMVQVEAMIQGTPVVASDLPGSRQPVLITDMGKITPIKNAEALAKGIIEILQNKESYIKDTETIAKQFSSASSADFYEKKFQELINAK